MSRLLVGWIIFLFFYSWSLGDIPPLQLLAGSGSMSSVDGVGAYASFDTPLSIASSRNSMYAIVTERIKIRQINLSTGYVSTLAGASTQGNSDGVGSRAQFFRPIAVAVSAKDIAYIADWNINVTMNRIRVLDIASTRVSTLKLSGGVSLKGPSAVALSDDDSILFVGDTWWILQIDLETQILSWLTGSGYSISYQDGIGYAAFFVHIGALAVGPSNSYLLVTDSNFASSATVQSSNSLRLVNVSTRQVSTVCGGIQRGFADGVGTHALLDQPAGVTLDQEVNLAMIADYGNQRIRSFDLVSETMMTLVGTGQPLPPISSQRVNQGNSIAFTADGLNLLINNITGNAVYVIRCPTLDCGPNTYKSPCGITSPAGGDGRCLPCPNSTVSKKGSTSVNDCVCGLGQYGPASSCTLCPAGTYKDYSTNISLGIIDCLPCNLTGFSSLPGSRSKMNCTQCSPGYYRLRGTCTPCPRNTSKSTMGDANCSTCPRGSTSGSGASSCTCGLFLAMQNSSCVCIAGYYGQTGGPCTACPSGTYKNLSNAPGNCSKCPADMYSLPGQAQCTCNAGFSSDVNGDNLTCMICPNGTFKNVSGNQACTLCDIPRVCQEPLSIAPNTSNTSINLLGFNSTTFYETFASFSPLGQTLLPLQGGLFWFGCTPLINGQCLRCPSAQLVAIPSFTGIASCSCRSGFYAVSVFQSLSYLNNLSTNPNTNESFFLYELSRTETLLAGKEICRACPNGTFKNYVGAGPGTCSPCPLHSTSKNQSTDLGACMCNAGYFQVLHALARSVSVQSR